MCGKCSEICRENAIISVEGRHSIFIEKTGVMDVEYKLSYA